MKEERERENKVKYQSVTAPCCADEKLVHLSYDLKRKVLFSHLLIPDQVYKLKLELNEARQCLGGEVSCVFHIG